jgi:triacylglycerol lipase
LNHSIATHDLEESMNLVFASGFLVPQSILGINYFNGVEARFKGRHQTLFPPVQPLESCEARANELADEIAKRFPEGEIHIIAHSMGGLDSRSLIGRNRNGLSAPGRIKSLTTLATPHFGSPVADLLVGPEPIGPGFLLYEAASLVLRQLNISIGALGDLTTAGALRIPNVVKSHPHIRYRSCFAEGRPSPFAPTCTVLLPTHEYVQSVAHQGVADQANDGLVTLKSASYGELQQPFFPCDHADLVGHNLDGPGFNGFQFDHLTEFERLIDGLQAR